MADCFFHTGRPAVTRCKQCGRPLCSECRLITPEGIFCGEKCAETAKIAAERLREIEEKRAASQKGTIQIVIGRIISIIIIFAILYAVYKFLIIRFIR
ncbi:MAG TPA: B-box zinc finger protein [bacterium]|nr:B-box zinc finger protein [bacterium]